MFGAPAHGQTLCTFAGPRGALVISAKNHTAFIAFAARARRAWNDFSLSTFKLEAEQSGSQKTQ